MCGRLTQNTAAAKAAAVLEITSQLELPPRYNVAPSQPLAAIRQSEGGLLEWVLLRWGLLPHWAKDPKIAYKMINAKAETVAQKPAFRSALRQRRCVIPADGFYEWQKLGSRKQPYFIRPTDDRVPFFFAGLWEHWEGDGETVESCTIITTSANGLVHEIHDRMPVIIGLNQVQPWLDRNQHDPRALTGMLQPAPDSAVTAYPVTPQVNTPAFDQPQCNEPWHR